MIKNNVIARKTVSMLTALAMIIAGLGFLVSNPQDAYADDTKTVKVNFTTSVDNAFVHAPQFNVEINSGLAEYYGYTDAVSSDTGVSALDVLVKAHEIIFGEAFKNSNETYLEVNESGTVTLFLGEAGDNFGFTVNGKMTHNDELSGGYYLGYMVNQSEVVDNDSVEFFLYEGDYWDDISASIYEGDQILSEINLNVGESKTLNIKGYSLMWYGTCADEVINQNTKAIEGVHLALVNKDTGEITDINNAITDKDGNVELLLEEEGTYYMTAYMPKGSGTNVLLRIIKVNVKTKATTPTTDNTDKTTTGKTDSTETTKTETTAAKNENSPKTGDDFNAVPLIAIAICAAAVGGATLIRRKPEGK